MLYYLHKIGRRMKMERKIESRLDLMNCVYEFIKEKGLSVGDVEEKVGYSAGMISRWKKLKEGPTLERILDILNLLNVELYIRKRDFYDNEKDSPRNAKEGELLQNPVSILQMGLINTINSYLQDNKEAEKEFKKIIEIVLNEKFNYEEFLCAFILFLSKLKRPA